MLEETKTYGTVQYKGLELTLMQQPYIEGSFVNPAYWAYAIDDDEGEYEIKWKITNPDCIDESEACDWTKYQVRKL